jgi:RNA polymerase sigma-70 factor (ECF subfamily)
MSTPSTTSYPQTRWTWVRQAQDAWQAEETSFVGMDEICAAYWYPLYASARRKRGLDHHAAEDAAQAFWAWFVDSGHVRDARPERGRFRSFLAAYFDNFLANHLRAERAQKRGGAAQMISRDGEDWSARYELEMGSHASPDEHLDAVWRRAGMEAAFAEVEALWLQRGRWDFFLAMKEHLEAGGERGGYGEIARKLDLTEVNVRQLARQLRLDLRAALARWIGE